MNNICWNCYWYSMENPRKLTGVCHNVCRRMFVGAENSCELFEERKSKIEQLVKEKENENRTNN